MESPKEGRLPDAKQGLSLKEFRFQVILIL